ncbi:MAG: MotA/TolQ/ExbB proton channel family protein [Verrucomicrobiota bacterium JB022]|nr:MotA/TolQ/ExbB proton channel family protein [Verrucomicrobiota bacterium JB022]
MYQLFEDAGVFAWPLLLCSVLAMVIIIERLIALRTPRVIPKHYQDAFMRGEVPAAGDHTVMGRIVTAFHQAEFDSDQLKAVARLQVTRMERGLFIVEVIIAAAPLIGLLGTVTGLVNVFGQIDAESGLPDSKAFVEGVALALTTTMLGLSIAIPALAANGYLQRRIDTFSAMLGVGVERLVALKREQEQKQPAKV